MDELKQDLKEIKSDISDIKNTIAINTTLLDVHIKRTNLNEARIEKLEYWALGLLGAILVALLVKTL